MPGSGVRVSPQLLVPAFAEMTSPQRSLSIAAFASSGAMVGVLSAFVFCVIHQLIISSIWFAIGAMLVAGAVCGTCLRLELRIEH